MVENYKPNCEIKHSEGKVTVGYQLSETMDDYRVYGKSAFNVLADIKVKEYVLNSDFDKYREWLIGKGDSDYDNFLPLLKNTPLYNFIHDNKMTEALISEPLQDKMLILLGLMR